MVFIKYMKFNYQKEEEDDSDQEFLDSGISTSFTFEKTERDQLRNIRKWLRDIGISYTVTKFRNEEGKKMYCLVAYEETVESESEYPEVEKEALKKEVSEEIKTKSKKNRKKTKKMILLKL